jgi:hypothetical protein
MAEKDSNASEMKTQEYGHKAKKPYQEPAFRHERVFETMALSCGKVDATEFQCRFHRMSS